MNKRLGFFDADCRELADGNSLGFRPRVMPIADKCNKLYKLVEENHGVLLFTTCCSGNFLKPDSREDVLFIPCDSRDTAWKDKINDYKLFYLEKITHHNPTVDFECKSFNTFTYNSNASFLLKELGIEEWVAFGNGLDYCVNHAVLSILTEGYKVTFLSDVMISSAKGYDACSGTEENKIAVYKNWVKKGAKQQTLDQFLSCYKGNE